MLDVNNPTPGQVIDSVKAGVQLLSDPQVRVPADLAASGKIVMLYSLLQAISRKEILLVNAPLDQPEEEGES